MIAPAAAVDGRENAGTPAAARARQAQKLRAMVAYLRDRSAFHRHRLAAIAGEPDATDARPWLAGVPFTTRADLEADQAAHPPFGAGACIGLPDAALLARSGVGFTFSGRRLNVMASHRDVQRHGLVMRQALEMAGLRPGDRLYVADDPRYNAISVYTVRAATDLGLTMVYVAAERTRRNARFVARVLPGHAYVVTPTYALYLAEVLAQEGRKDLPIKALVGWGEPGFSQPGWRARVRAAWAPIVVDPDFRIVDVYAMSEAGVLAYGCAAGGALHCPPASLLVEVVDPLSGRPMPAGERGEVVLTQLEPLGQPLVRYRTGDVATLEEGCPCGWPYATLRGLERLADLVEVGARLVSATAVEEALLAMLPSAAFRILRGESAARLHLEVASAGSWSAGAVEGDLATALGVPVHVAVLETSALPAFRHRRLRVLDRETAALHAELHQDDLDLE